MVICEKCKNLCDCKDGQIFLELKKAINYSVVECDRYVERKPEFTIIRGGK